MSALGVLSLALFAVPQALGSTYTISADGAPHVVKSTVADENITVKFAGIATHRISLNMTNVTIGTSRCCSTQVSIKKPDGSNLVAPFNVGTTGKFLDVKTLPVDGTYKIFIDPQGTVKGSMTLTLYDVPPDDSKAIVPGGASVDLTTTVPGQNAQATFTGALGQRISLQLSNAAFGTSLTAGGKVSIVSPDSSTLAASTSFGTNGLFIDTKTLPAAGTYTIKVNPTAMNVGSVTLTLFDVPADSTAAVTPGGSAATVTTTAPGQNAYATFSGALNQRVSVWVANETFGASSCCDAKVSLVKPDGSTLVAPVNLGSAGAFLDAVTLPVAGTYKVLVDPQGMGTGTADVTVYSVPPDANGGTLTLGTGTVLTTTSPGQNAFATFTGAANQRVSLDISSVSLSSCSICLVKVSLIQPGGTALVQPTSFGTTGKFVDPVKLPVSGTYKVVLDVQNTGTGSMTLTAYNVLNDVVDTVAVNGSKTVTTTSPGQNAKVTFNGTSGQRISFNFTNVTIGSSCCTGVRITITKPGGTSELLPLPLSLGTNGKFMEPVALPTTGTYTMLIDPQGAAVGSITINHYVVPADVNTTISANGSSVNLTLAVGQNATYSFSGTAGRRVSLKLSGVTFGPASCCVAKFLSPSNATVGTPFYFGGQATDFVDPVTLPSTGTYKLKIDPLDASAGTATLNLYTVPADVTGSVGNPGSTSVSIGTPGQAARVTFSATSGSTVNLAASNVTIGPSTTDSTTIWILDSNGDSIGTPLTTGTDGAGPQAFWIPATGTYTILVDPALAGTGSLTLTLS